MAKRKTHDETNMFRQESIGSSEKKDLQRIETAAAASVQPAEPPAPRAVLTPYDVAADLWVLPSLVGVTVARGQQSPTPFSPPGHHLVTVAVYVDVWRQLLAMTVAWQDGIDRVSSLERDAGRRAALHGEGQKVQVAWERFARIRAWVEGGGLDAGEVAEAMRGPGGLAEGSAGSAVRMVDVEPPWESDADRQAKAAAPLMHGEADGAEQWNDTIDGYWEDRGPLRKTLREGGYKG